MVGGSNPFAETQSVYSTAPANLADARVSVCVCVCVCVLF